MKNKYRVVWKDVVIDHHFGPEPDKVLFESESLEECENFMKDYLEKHHGFFELVIREYRHISFYDWVTVKEEMG